MDDETALNIIEAYFEKKATAGQYQAALNYLADTPAVRSRLASLYRELTQPGGIDCETAQADMLGYLDPVARKGMSKSKRANFLLHLAVCVNCAEEYLELSSFGENLEQDEALVIPHFKIPKAVKVSWPSGWRKLVEEIVDTAKALKVVVSFEPKPALVGVREESAVYEIELPKITLLAQNIGSNLPVQVHVEAARLSNETCNITVQLSEISPLAGHSLILSYGQTRLEQTTNTFGKAVFQAVPIAMLEKFRLDIQINLYLSS